MPTMAWECKEANQYFDFCRTLFPVSADWGRLPMQRRSPSWRELRAFNATRRRSFVNEMTGEAFDAMIAAVIDEAAQDYLNDPELTVFHALDGEELVFSGG